MSGSRLKRKRAAISYREDTTDEDIDEDTRSNDELPPSSPARSTPRRSRRRQPTRINSASLPQGVRHSRRARPVPSYKEPSSDLSGEDEPVDEPDDVAGQHADTHSGRNRSKPATPARRTTRRVLRSAGPVSNKRGAGGSGKRTKAPVNALPGPEPAVLPSDNVCPPWATLPYYILLQIFVYASHPLQGDSGARISWLLNMARLCSSFLDPALTALYRSPPLNVLDKMRRNKLLSLLTDNPSSGSLNYNVKVQQLEIDVTRVLTQTRFDLGTIIRALPQLSHIDLFDPADMPPYRRTDRRSLSSRWHYPDDMLQAFAKTGIHLKSWRWNLSMMARDHADGLMWMKEIHSDEVFRSLTALHFTNYESQGRVKLEKDDAESEGPTSEELLASAIVVLPNLRHLSFECCEIVNKEFLPLLPMSLSSLTITNCEELTSEILGPFLVSHGRQLKELVLNHNQALDIAFLPELKASCPHLEVLRMDLNYYNSYATYRDSDPKYVDLLKPEEVPSWPSSLQVIEMVYLRNWTSSAAESFFQSLIDSSKELPRLRVLILRAILDISWRERANFRDRWISRLRRVFLKRCSQPSAHLYSLRAFAEWKEQQARPKVSEETSGAVSTANTVPDTDDEKRESPPWSGRRLRSRSKPTRHNTSDSEEHSHSEMEHESSGAEDDTALGETFIQGSCTTLDVRIDNLRPREALFGEEDFLDSEISGDEDWNEDEDNDGDVTYAW